MKSDLLATTTRASALDFRFFAVSIQWILFTSSGCHFTVRFEKNGLRWSKNIKHSKTTSMLTSAPYISIRMIYWKRKYWRKEPFQPFSGNLVKEQTLLSFLRNEILGTTIWNSRNFPFHSQSFQSSLTRANKWNGTTNCLSSCRSGFNFDQNGFIVSNIFGLLT